MGSTKGPPQAGAPGDPQLISLLERCRWLPSGVRLDSARVVSATPLLGDPPIDCRQVAVDIDGRSTRIQLLVGPADHASPANGREIDVFDRPRDLIALLERMRMQVDVVGEGPTLSFRAGDPTGRLADLPTSARTIDGEQTNSSAVFGERLLLKVYRFPEPGVHPEPEMLELLASRGFASAPRLLGWYQQGDTVLGIVETYVAGGRDGWSTICDLIRRSEPVGPLLHTLGRTVRAMADALSPSDDGALPKEVLPVAALRDRARRLVISARDSMTDVGELAGQADRFAETVDELAAGLRPAPAHRVHGDLHLGQTLVVDGSWTIVDFEGSPLEPLGQRRRTDTPLRDLAALLRSVDYAAAVAGAGSDWVGAARSALIAGYCEVPEGAPSALDEGPLLRLLELERAIHELRYEAAHRPGWMHIPIRAILELISP